MPSRLLFSSVKTSAPSIPPSLLLPWDFSPDKTKFFRMRKSLDGRCSVVGIAQPFARSGNPARKRIKKILQLTHRVFSFTFPHCTAVGFRLNLARWPLRLLTTPPLSFVAVLVPASTSPRSPPRCHYCRYPPPFPLLLRSIEQLRRRPLKRRRVT